MNPTKAPSLTSTFPRPSRGRLALTARMIGLMVLAFWSLSCASRSGASDLRDLYQSAEQARRRNPVIIIPGFFGTRLVDDSTGDVLWGAVGTGTIRPSNPAGARHAALPIHDRSANDTDLLDRSTGEQVVPARPDGILDAVEIRLLGLSLEVSVYRALLDTFGRATGDSSACGPRDRTCFVFAYDWRRDSVENAQRLEEFIDETRTSLLASRAGTSEPGDLKFDLVAHSLGGVLARYFLRYGSTDLPPDGSLPELTWRGARYVERAILVAPPNFGTLGSLNQLVNGREFPPGIADYPPAILGTFPSAYQLLPRARHETAVWADETGKPIGDFFDPELWQHLQWGLADPDEAEVLGWLLPEVDDPVERRRIALDFQRHQLQRARSFTEALDRPALPPDGLDLYLVTGDAIDTVSRITVDRETGALAILDREPGDGTVLRSSALGDEGASVSDGHFRPNPIVWRSTLFLSAGHLGITKDRDFANNALYWLQNPVRLRSTKAP